MIYLDNSATTKPCAAAVEAMTQMLTTHWGNPSSVHGMGVETERKLKQARQDVAQLLGAEPDRVFFTSGGTEADNWAIFAAAERLGKRGKHIVTTRVEHHAVLHPVEKLQAQGFEVTYLEPDENGVITVQALEQALRKDTILVSVMMVNNETGAVMPIEKMIKSVRRLSPIALFHTDAVQALGKIPFKAKTLGADLISVSAHKIHGPKGVGALYIKKGLSLPPFIRGGGQESGLRSGTEAVPAIVGFGAACAAMDPAREIKHLTHLRDLCREALADVPGLVFTAPAGAPHVVPIAIPGVRSQGLINCLQDHGIYVSAGSACAKGHRSHVLQAQKIAPELIDGAIRISFSRDNVEEDIPKLKAALLDALHRL
ncbi:MAG: cysteine desulfurase [Oscillospiraceae bacterium]|nr:cysteine desulfurase [Oscillospiraceae bacterium]